MFTIKNDFFNLIIFHKAIEKKLFKKFIKSLNSFFSENEFIFTYLNIVVCNKIKRY